MQLSKKPTVNNKSLICSIQTLFGNDTFFKKPNIENNVYSNLSFHNEEGNFLEIYNLLNKVLIKQFAFKLLTPFVKSENDSPDWDIVNRFAVYEENIILLKKYLRKFRHNYKFYQDKNHSSLPTNKEINMYAIEMLFLMASI
jgi:hypothetical protein